MTSRGERGCVFSLACSNLAPETKLFHPSPSTRCLHFRVFPAIVLSLTLFQEDCTFPIAGNQ